jgi:FkbM family methyltransferase
MVQENMIFQPHTYSIQSDPKNDVDRIGKEIFEADCYFPAFGNKVIVDVGACIGLFSMYAYKFAKQIYSIEPHPVSYGNLVMNMLDNKLDKVKTFNLAISGQNGDGWIQDARVLEGCTFGFDKGSHEVKALTLASFFKENNIQYADIVKIDTEGSEHEIFKAKDIEEIKDKVGVFIIEVHGSLELPFEGWTLENQGGGIFLFHRV